MIEKRFSCATAEMWDEDCWPPSFGLTVRVLLAVHWVLRKRGKSYIKLHPDEITHVRTRGQVRAYLAAANFSLIGDCGGSENRSGHGRAHGPYRVGLGGPGDVSMDAQAVRHRHYTEPAGSAV